MSEEIKSALPLAIICDVDGTLAINSQRGPFESDLYNTDSLNEPVARMLKAWIARETDCFLIIVSGRYENFREVTEDWLMIHGINWDECFMRPSGDRRLDSEIKQEIYDQKIKGKYNVLAVIEDRQRVVEMWRANGLPCFQVAEGAF